MNPDPQPKPSKEQSQPLKIVPGGKKPLWSKEFEDKCNCNANIPKYQKKFPSFNPNNPFVIKRNNSKTPNNQQSSSDGTVLQLQQHNSFNGGKGFLIRKGRKSNTLQQTVNNQIESENKYASNTLQKVFPQNTNNSDSQIPEERPFNKSLNNQSGSMADEHKKNYHNSNTEKHIVHMPFPVYK